MTGAKLPPVVGTLVSPNSPEWKYVFVCCNSESYRNAYIRDMGKCIDDLKIQHLYIDNCWSMFCANGSHGCGWKDEFGKEYQTATVLGSREVAKGIYRELKSAIRGEWLPGIFRRYRNRRWFPLRTVWWTESVS